MPNTTVQHQVVAHSYIQKRINFDLKNPFYETKLFLKKIVILYKLRAAVKFQWSKNVKDGKQTFPCALSQ